MAKYNTFIVMECKHNNVVLVTSSARKVTAELWKGRRVEVWNENERIEIIYSSKAENMKRYILQEKEYIRRKQQRAEFDNAYRRAIRT